jgi:hypothetical protein
LLHDIVADLTTEVITKKNAEGNHKVIVKKRSFGLQQSEALGCVDDKMG